MKKVYLRAMERDYRICHGSVMLTPTTSQLQARNYEAAQPSQRPAWIGAVSNAVCLPLLMVIFEDT